MATLDTESQVTKNPHLWKWTGRVISLAGFGTPIILLPLIGRDSINLAAGLVIFGIFIAIQGMALSSFAECKEVERPDSISEGSKKKRAFFWYTSPNIFCALIGLTFVFQHHMFNVSKIEPSLLPKTLSTGILLGGLFGLAKTWLVLVHQIHEGTIREGYKKTQNLSRFFLVLQFIVILLTMHNREMICQYFSNTTLSTCSAPMIIFGSFFLGVLLVELFWIFLWEHRQKKKLYM